ncbi:MAG: DUF3883 domain-containing protein [Saprospiraceae bacterium]|nr:DUF3883 domain-containing protein [Saprospiraceae bacterium]
MSISEEFNALREDKRYSIPAKRLKDHLKPILSKSEMLKKRWMWELLQNASDLSDSIEAEFELLDDKVIFRHNGPPFSLEEAYNLIMPDSGKDEEDGVEKKRSIIGQFGTGFISTHILSAYIEVKGVVETQNQSFYKFAYALDRINRDDKELLIQSIVKAEKQYEEELVPIPDYEIGQSMDTEFVYHLSEVYQSLEPEEIVEAGIKFFDDIIPFVLAFRSQLNCVKLIDKRNSQQAVRQYSSIQVHTDISNLSIYHIKCKNNEDGESGIGQQRVVGVIQEQHTYIAFLLENHDNDQYRIIGYPDECPRLFCAFPMVGSEYFTYPVVIHSEQFEPNKERDGIELSIHDKENRKRLIEANIAFSKLMTIAEKYKWLDVFHICHVKIPSLNDAITNKWLLDSIFKPLAQSIRNADIIELDSLVCQNNQRSNLGNMLVPYADGRLSDKYAIVQKIHDLTFGIEPQLVSKKEHAIAWYDCINFDFFENEKLDYEELVKLATNNNKINSLAGFCTEFSLENDKAVEWIKEFIIFLKEKEQLSLLNQYNIVPNQNNYFKPLNKLYNDNIFHDHLNNKNKENNSYEEKLKDIYSEIAPDKDFRNILLHADFHDISGIIDKDMELSLNDLCTSIDQAFLEYTGDNKDEDYLQNLQQLFNWYSNCGLSEDILKKLFPWFSDNRSQLYMNTQTPEQRDLAFTIIRSGKTDGLAALAKSNLTNEELLTIARNHNMVNQFFGWLNERIAENPDKVLGDIGEEFIYHFLCEKFGKEMVIKLNLPEYDFKILNQDQSTKYYIDAKTIAKGIANSEAIPFFMRLKQWQFLEKEEAKDKYLIARVFKDNGTFEVKFLNILLEEQF